jgi:hypothetical protein
MDPNRKFLMDGLKSAKSQLKKYEDDVTKFAQLDSGTSGVQMLRNHAKRQVRIYEQLIEDLEAKLG